MSFVGRIQQGIADLGPWWLQGRNIGTFLESIGLTLDGALETLTHGMRLSQPLRGDVNALPYLSTDRGIAIYPNEPDASRRYRLSQFWQLRRQFGTHQGEMRNVQPYFLPGALPVIRIVHQAGDGSSATWHTLAADGTYSVHRSTPSNWDWDGVDAKWSRYWAIVYTTGLIPTAQPTWDGGQLWDGGSVWDGLFTSGVIDDLVSAFTDAKSAHSILWGLILAPDSASFDPTATAVVDAAGWSTLPNGKWGYVIDNVTGQPTRLPSATYAYDLGQG